MMNRTALFIGTALALTACTDQQPNPVSPATLTPSAEQVERRGGGNSGSILFASNATGSNHIWIMDRDGTDQHDLTNDNTAVDAWPGWSPNGKRIAFSSKRGTDAAHIYTMDADGTNVTQVTDGDAPDIQPAWSPDGNEIAFVRGALHSRQIWVVSLKNGTEHLLTDAGDNYRPAWSPDGRTIAFSSDRNGDFDNALPREKGDSFGLHDIYIMDARTGRILSRVTDNPTSLDAEPSFSPDGRQIAFRTRREETGLRVDLDGPFHDDHYCSIAVTDVPKSAEHWRGHDHGDRARDRDQDHVRILTPIPPDLTALDWCNAFPSWSSDGTEIYFHSARPVDGVFLSTTDIYAVHPDGTGLHRLTVTPLAGETAPAAR